MRSLNLGILALAASLSLAACSSAPEQAPIERTPMNSHIANALDGAPEWVTGDCSSYLAKIGRGEKLCASGAIGGSRNIALMKQNSAQRARVELANMLQTKVKAMIRDYQRTVTGGKDFGQAADDEQFAESTSKTIVDMTLSGTQVIATWASQTGELWSLVVLDTEAFKDSLNSIAQLNASVRDYVVKNAERAFSALDQEIATERGEVPPAVAPATPAAQ